jgi:fibro-slime domain-containing protein
LNAHTQTRSTTFQTAILSGLITGSNSTVLSVRGDDDVLVYIDGTYVGGTPGVHADTGWININLSLTNGPHALKVFYADRAETEAKFGIDVGNGDINPVPGPIVGAGLPGLMMALGGLVILSRLRRNQGA